MFTGIITAIGTVQSINKHADWQLVIKTSWNCEQIDLGASIACSGVCLTVTDTDKDCFSVSVSHETLKCTMIKDWQQGSQINLERALRLGDELGGHMVSGHVDGLAVLKQITPVASSYQLKIEAPDDLAHFIAEKGSVTLDGVSLTVNAVEGNFFWVNIIDHTWTHTTLGAAQPGQHLNIEIDMLARYVSRLIKG